MDSLRRPTFAFLAFATLAAATTAVAPASHAKTPTPFVPDQTQTSPGSATLEGETWSDITPDYSIRVQHIDAAERLAYITHVTGLNTDPFASPPGDKKHFTTFAVQIENSGETELSFNPDATWLTSLRQKDLLTPYGIDDLAFDYRVAGSRLPPAYKHAEKALLQYPTFIDDGDTLSGLLIFRGVRADSKKMQLELSITLASGDTVEFKAPYRRLSKKEFEQAETESQADASGKDTP